MSETAPLTMSRHRTSGGRIVGSVFSNGAGFAIRLAVSLITTPLFIDALGRGRYGSWVLLWSTAAYLTILDLGLGLAIRRFVARSLATGDREERDRKFSACLSVYLALSGLMIAGGLPLVSYLGDVLRLDPAVRPLAGRIGVFLVLDAALSFPTNAFQGLLTAYQRYELTNAIRVAMEVTRNLVLISAATAGCDLVTLAALQFSSSLLTCGLMVFAARRVASPIGIRLFRLNLATLREILGYSGWVVAFLAAQQALQFSATVLVGIFVSAAAAAEFYVAYRLVVYLAALPTLMTNVLVPLASEREAQSDWSSLRRVFVIGGNAQALIVAPAGVGVLFLGEAFFRAWLGPGFDRSAVYLMLLIAPILASQGTASSILLGIGRQRLLALIGVAAAVLTLGGAAALAARFGAVGISAAYATVGTMANVAIYFYCARLLELPPLRTLLRIWAGPLVSVAPMAAFLGWASGRLDGGPRFLAFIALAGAAGAVYLAAAAAIYRRWPNGLPAIEKLSGILGAGWTRRRARSRPPAAPVDRQAGPLPFER